MNDPQPLDDLGKYVYIKDLGEGGVSPLVLARITKTGEQVAIKRVSRESVKHFQLNIVMEYATGGSLFTYVQQWNRLEEALARWFFQQLVLGMDCLQRKGVPNTNIRLENILLAVAPGLPRPLVKLHGLDYNLHNVLGAKVGPYTAPETLKGQQHDHMAADVWRCGVVLYSLLTGRYPFQAPGKASEADWETTLKNFLQAPGKASKTDWEAALRNVVQAPGMDSETDWETTLRNVKSSELYLPDSLGLTQECTNLLRELLHADPQQRIDIAGIMVHPWFLKHLPPNALHMNDCYLSNTRPFPQSGEGKDATTEAQLMQLQNPAVSSSSSGPPISTTAAPPQLPGSSTQLQPMVAVGQQSSQQQGTAVTATQGSAQPLKRLLQALEPTAAGQLQDAAAQVSATCSYQVIRQQQDQRMFGSNRSLLARCHRSNRQRTILQLPRQQLQQDPGCPDWRLLPGLQAVMQLQHPHVLQVQEVFVTPEHLNVVVEECSAGRLLDYAAAQPLGALSPGACRFFFQQLVLGVHCCHSQGAAGLDIQHTLLKVTAAVPQPLVKVAPPVLTQGLPLQPTEGDFRPPCVATSSAAQQDMWACGVLLVKLLGGTITMETASLPAGAAQHHTSSSSDVAAQDPVQQQRTVTHLFTLPEKLWEHGAGGNSDSVVARADVQLQQLLDLLQCILVPTAEQWYTIDEVFRHPWVQHGMTQKAKGLVLQGVSPQQQQQQQHSSQQPAEVEALVAAAASQDAPGQQIQQLVRCRTHSRQVTLQLRVLEELRLQGIGLQHARARLELSASRMGSAAFGAASKVTAEQVAQRVGVSMQCLATTLRERKQQHDLQQQQQQQSMAVSGRDISGNAAVLLRLCCTYVLYQAGRLQQLLHEAACVQPLTPAAILQQVQEHLLGLLVLYAGLMHTAQVLLHSLFATTAACRAVVRACRRCWRQAAARHKLLHILSAPPLMTSAAAVRQAVCATPLPLLADAALLVLQDQAHKVVPLLLLSAIINMWPTQTGTSLQQQQQQQHQNTGWEVLGPVASVAELPEGLTMQRQPLGVSGPAVQACGFSISRSCVAYACSYNNQAVVLVGLAPKCRLPCGAEQQQAAAAGGQDREEAELAARQHPGLALAGHGRVSDAGAQLRRVLYSLQHSEQQWLSGDGNSSSSSISQDLFVPTRLVCLKPPLLMVPQYTVGPLDQWIQQRADSIRAAAGGSSLNTNTAFTEAWLAALPTRQVLQLLLDTAAALHVMHSQSPACVHGEVHAGALYMLQDLSGRTAAAAESAQQQQQQQRVSQLSLVTLLSSMALVASYHPLLAAPECLLATGPPIPASDVYGFGVLMYQLISVWLPPPDAPGTDEHLARMQWTRNSLASAAGSASYLAALQAADRGRRSPYAGHLLTQAALAGLPAGYQALMVSCLNMQPPVRPCAAQLVTQVQLMLSEGST